jgi:hypothetical protein
LESSDVYVEIQDFLIFAVRNSSSIFPFKFFLVLAEIYIYHFGADSGGLLNMHQSEKNILRHPDQMSSSDKGNPFSF